MTGFFVLPRAVIIIVTISLTLCIISQTISVVTSFFRYPRNRARIFETVLEFLILGHIMLCTLLHMQAENEFISAVLITPDNIIIRYFIFIAVIAAVISVIRYTKKPGTIPVVIAAVITLPFIEHLTGFAFVYINSTVIIFWLIRSIVVSISYSKENKDSLSASSVKNTIDSMITGIMFCRHTGFILLVNERMKQLMTTITGKPQRNGRQFFSMLTLGEIQPDCKASWFEDKNVIILPDEAAWQFAVTELQIGKRTYIQMTATEITEQWNLTSRLHPQNDILLQRQIELNETIANLQILSREREAQNAKMRAHDILGKHLTVLQGIVFGSQKPDYSLLRSLSNGIMDDFNAASNEPTAQEELNSLKQIFTVIGVELEISGKIPDDPQRGRLFTEIIREAVNNSVRHGFASKIMVFIEETEAGSALVISDNGYSPVTLKEGGGIKAMRKKTEQWGGSMQVSLTPQFVLSVNIPR